MVLGGEEEVNEEDDEEGEGYALDEQLDGEGVGKGGPVGEVRVRDGGHIGGSGLVWTRWLGVWQEGKGMHMGVLSGSSRRMQISFRDPLLHCFHQSIPTILVRPRVVPTALGSAVAMDPLDFDQDHLHETRAERLEFDEHVRGLLLDSWEKRGREVARDNPPPDPPAKPTKVSPKLQTIIHNHQTFLKATEAHPGNKPKFTRRKGLVAMDKLNLARQSDVFQGCVVAVVHHLSAKPEQLVTRWTLVSEPSPSPLPPSRVRVMADARCRG